MIDVFRKGLLIGLGAGLLAKDSLEKTVAEILSKGESGAKQAEEVSAEVTGRIRRELERLESKGQEEIRDSLAEAGLATRKEVEELAARVSRLEQAMKDHAASVHPAS